MYRESISTIARIELADPDYVDAKPDLRDQHIAMMKSAASHPEVQEFASIVAMVGRLQKRAGAFLEKHPAGVEDTFMKRARVALGSNACDEGDADNIHRDLIVVNWTLQMAYSLLSQGMIHSVFPRC